MYKYTVLVYIYTNDRLYVTENHNTLQQEGVVYRDFNLCTTYSEAWNSLLYLVRGELRGVFLSPQALRPL